MKEIFIGLFTYEVAHALDRDLIKKVGGDFASIAEQQRLVAILFALRDMGSLHWSKHGRETSFYFDPEENLADDVLKIVLKKTEMLSSIALSKRIGPSLKEVWRRPKDIEKAKVNNFPHAQDDEFEIDPFIAQLARWVNTEVTTERPEFKNFDLAERMARTCIELQANGVAVKKCAERTPVWVTSAEIDVRIGGAMVSQNERFSISSGANATLLDQFQNAVNNRLKRRLASMLETEEAFFQMCNAGIIKIGSIDPDGQYRWVFADKNHRAGADFLEE